MNIFGKIAIGVCFVGLIVSWLEGNTSNMMLNGILLMFNLFLCFMGR